MWKCLCAQHGHLRGARTRRRAGVLADDAASLRASALRTEDNVAGTEMGDAHNAYNHKEGHMSTEMNDEKGRSRRQGCHAPHTRNLYSENTLCAEMSAVTHHEGSPTQYCFGKILRLLEAKFLRRMNLEKGS